MDQRWLGEVRLAKRLVRGYFLPALCFVAMIVPLSSVQAVAAPTSLKVEQLHRRYTDKQHRYKLTVQGTGLTGEAMKFSWGTDCGQFYGAEGQALGTTVTHQATAQIRWGYDLPTDCTEVQVAVAIQEGDSPLVGVQMTQKVFFPEQTPVVTTYQPRDPSEVQKIPLGRRFKVWMGSVWGWLRDIGRGRPEDPQRDEVPGGVTGVRG